MWANITGTFMLVFHYIPNSNLLFCGYEVCNFDVIYDEIYGVIYEVIMRKFRASTEPFWELKISVIYTVSDACSKTAGYFLWLKMFHLSISMYLATNFSNEGWYY
jgi:hypothetical protein